MRNICEGWGARLGSLPCSVLLYIFVPSAFSFFCLFFFCAKWNRNAFVSSSHSHSHSHFNFQLFKDTLHVSLAGRLKGSTIVFLLRIRRLRMGYIEGLFPKTTHPHTGTGSRLWAGCQSKFQGLTSSPRLDHFQFDIWARRRAKVRIRNRLGIGIEIEVGKNFVQFFLALNWWVWLSGCPPWVNPPPVSC